MEEGLAPGGAIVATHKMDLLRGVLGKSSGSVEFVVAEDWYRRPSTAIAGYESRLRALRGYPSVGGRRGPVRRQRGGVDRMDPLESALNDVLSRYCARVVCPYDTRSLPRGVIQDARRTHPHLREPRSRYSSLDYVVPERLVPQLPLTVNVPEWATDSEMRIDGAGQVHEARRVFAEAARRAGFAADRVDELTLGISEVLANALVHGGGRAWQRLWTESSTITCTIEDEGRGTADPLLGSRPPPPGAERGYGLWIARQLFERSELLASPGGGLMVTLSSTVDN